MEVSSKSLEDAIARLGEGSHPVALRNGARANRPQLEAAALLLRDADPSICNGISAEQPGYIRVSPDETILILEIGILPSTIYKINRQGELTDV